MQAFAELLTPRTKIVALVHVSNVLGNVLDTDYVVEEAHKVAFHIMTLQLLAYLCYCHLQTFLLMLQFCNHSCWPAAPDCSGVCPQVGAKVLLDCSQSVPGRPTDVQALGADWVVATGHKMCGPTGIGFLWGR